MKSIEEIRFTNTFIEPAEQYLRTFNWNKVKYRADKPLAEIIDSLQKVSIQKPTVLDTSLLKLWIGTC